MSNSLLADRHVDLWYTRLESAMDQRLLDEYRTLITPEEVAQEKRFVFFKDSHQYLVARAGAHRPVALQQSGSP